MGARPGRFGYFQRRREEASIDDRIKRAAKDDLLDLDPALLEKAKLWFAEAREQTRRDDEEVAAWRRAPGGGDGGSRGFADDGGDWGGGD